MTDNDDTRAVTIPFYFLGNQPDYKSRLLLSAAQNFKRSQKSYLEKTG